MTHNKDRITNLYARIPLPDEASPATVVADGEVQPAHCYRCGGRLWSYHVVPSFTGRSDPECEAYRTASRCEGRHYRLHPGVQFPSPALRVDSLFHQPKLVAAVAEFIASNPGIDPILPGEVL